MPLCPYCDAEVTEAQRFCGRCGATLSKSQSPPAPKRSRLARVVLWSIGTLFALSLLRAILPEQNTQRAASDAEQSSVQNSPNVTQAQSSRRKVQEDPPPTYKMGQPFSIGYWSYLCHGAFWTPVLGSNPYSMERANADFVVIDITVRNDDTSSSTLPPFQLIDPQGRTYDESSKSFLSEGYFSVLEQLNPGVSKRGKIAFDVPPDRQYFLVASGGIESAKRVRVTLPMSVPPNQPSTPDSSQ